MNKLKIGIITFHNADNLGAVLQTYALQTVMNLNGYKTEIIDYRCDAIEKSRYAFKKSYRMKERIKAVPLAAYYAIKRSGFNKFRKQRLVLSKRIYDKRNISESNEVYDGFITGSDQVWNLSCSGHDYSYFLDFVKRGKFKCSYAASIGNYEYTEDEIKKIGDCIRDYAGISVREKSSEDKLLLCGINDVFVHPDPVFLLNREDWKGLMSRRLKKSKYVFVYLIQEDVNVYTAAKQYADKNGCKLIVNKKSAKFIFNGSPSDFLSWIYYADAVFTNSFHAAAFSIIFEKKLGADVELKNGKINNRVSELLCVSTSDNCIIGTAKQTVKAQKSKELSEMIGTAKEYLMNITD